MTMADTPIRFIVVRVTGPDPDRAALEAHDAIAKVMGGAVRKHAQLVDMSTTGRDPQSPVPEESAVHVATLRDAGHHGPADHLEKVSALHARETAEHLAARTKLLQGMPHGVCAPTAPTTDHAAILLAESAAARDAAADVHEHWIALRNLAHVAAQDPDSIDAATVLRAVKAAETKRAERVAKREATAKLVAEKDAIRESDKRFASIPMKESN